jgi:hypothetical protein
MGDTTPALRALERANSHIRYWRYRKAIGNPFPLTTALREWWARLKFELKVNG